MNTTAHWQGVYDGKAPDEQTWYQERPDRSLELIERYTEGPASRVVDVGGGASTLVDHLLDRGGYEVTVVDIAPVALEAAQRRLGERAERVDWVVADLTEPLDVEGPFDVWHDRAVLHFLDDEADRETYMANLERHVAEDGHAIISTFAPDGPDSCSGLSVCRYSPNELAEVFGDDWELVESDRELHETPWGGEQAFCYGVLTRS